MKVYGYAYCDGFTARTLNEAHSAARSFDEHALRFMQAERDYPGLNHRGTEPANLTPFYGDRKAFLTREFNRTWDLEGWKEQEARKVTREIRDSLARLNSIHS